MTRAKRLHSLLKSIKSRETKPLFNILKEIFEVYEHLIYVKKEIDAFELEIKQFNMAENTQFKNIISTLNTIASFPCTVLFHLMLKKQLALRIIK